VTGRMPADLLVNAICLRKRPDFTLHEIVRPKGARLPSVPQATRRARFDVQKPLTATTRSASGCATRTGQTGMPFTWRRSSQAKSCRNKQFRSGDDRRAGARTSAGKLTATLKTSR
jgi:hypothetical protein